MEDKDLFFNDERRKIDLVLVHDALTDNGESPEVIKSRDDSRKMFEENLLEIGVEIEEIPPEESLDGETRFLKIHMPYPLLLTFAEQMKLQLPLDCDKRPPPVHMDSLYTQCLKGKKTTERKKACVRESYRRYTAVFTVDRATCFAKYEQTGRVHFRDALRSQIAQFALNETSYGKAITERGVYRLLRDDVYTACYPLHDAGSYDRDSLHPKYNVRGTLYNQWVCWDRAHKYQPLDTIRYYYGEKIGVYFAWSGFYIQMLASPAVIGLIVFGFSVARTANNTEFAETCQNSTANFVGDRLMCPQCDEACDFATLAQSCNTLMIAQFYDNFATVAYACIMCLWAVLFPEMWKRRSLVLAHRWNLAAPDDNLNTYHSEYQAILIDQQNNKVVRANKITGCCASRTLWGMFAVYVSVFWSCIGLLAVIAVLLYRMVAYMTVFYLHRKHNLTGEFQFVNLVVTGTAAVLSFVLLSCLSPVYYNFALWITEMEQPTNARDYMQSVTFKTFCFQCVNYYAYPMYLALIKPVRINISVFCVPNIYS